MFYDILERKNVFLSYKKKKFKKSKNGHFSKGVSAWLWSKIDHFSIFFFKVNAGQENAFFDIVKRKKVGLSYKTRSSKSGKIAILKGVSLWFWSKIGHFSIFCIEGV